MAIFESTLRVAELGITPEDLRRLARLVEENHLSELRYEEGDFRITLRTAAYTPSQNVLAASAVNAPLGEVVEFYDEAAPVASATDTVSTNLVRIEAPVMGVFYRSPAPGDAPFVEVGDMVEVGQVVGMIEAMKVFSEVPSEISGRVHSLPAANAALVQPGDALVLLEPIS